MKIGYFLSSEELGPADQLAQARAARDAGFSGLWISDHFHPWTNAQGNSPFVWSMIGALSQFGKLGMTCIGNSPEEADELFQRTVALLDRETDHGDSAHGELGPLFDNTITME